MTCYLLRQKNSLRSAIVIITRRWVYFSGCLSRYRGQVLARISIDAEGEVVEIETKRPKDATIRSPSSRNTEPAEPEIKPISCPSQTLFGHSTRFCHCPLKQIMSHSALGQFRKSEGKTRVRAKSSECPPSDLSIRLNDCRRLFCREPSVVVSQLFHQLFCTIRLQTPSFT
jgi:hypothetical protein